MSNNAQTTVLLHSFHIPTRLCWKSFKLGFGSTWTENIQIYKLGLEKAEETEIICWIIEKEGNSTKTIYFCFIDCGKAFDYVDHKKW